MREGRNEGMDNARLPVPRWTAWEQDLPFFVLWHTMPALFHVLAKQMLPSSVLI